MRVMSSPNILSSHPMPIVHKQNNENEKYLPAKKMVEVKI